MRIEEFLSRLEGVKKTSRGWMAKCSAHEDRSPSMTIAEGDDGRILVKCWAGCGVDEIVGALNLELSDLFPERPKADHAPGLRVSFPAADVLAAVDREVFYVAYMAATMAQGHTLTATDRTILWQAYERLMEARRLALGER